MDDKHKRVKSTFQFNPRYEKDLATVFPTIPSEHILSVYTVLYRESGDVLGIIAKIYANPMWNENKAWIGDKVKVTSKGVNIGHPHYDTREMIAQMLLQEHREAKRTQKRDTNTQKTANNAL